MTHELLVSMSVVVVQYQPWNLRGLKQRKFGQQDDSLSLDKGACY